MLLEVLTWVEYLMAPHPCKKFFSEAICQKLYNSFYSNFHEGSRRRTFQGNSCWSLEWSEDDSLQLDQSQCAKWKNFGYHEKEAFATLKK